MADTKLRAILEAENQMDGSLGSAQGSLSKLGGAVRGVGHALQTGLVVAATAAIGAVAGLGAVLASSVKEAMAAEEVTAQLNAVLVSTKGVAGVSANAINDHALALSEMTRYEDDAIVGADALLLTFTKIGKDIFPKATELTLDLATAFKMDLKSAAMMVGKALNDPVKGLTAMGKAGVTFSQSQKDMIEAMVKVGSVAGAQRIIMAELETQVGGSARAAGETMAGQMDILKNALGNVKEEIGGALIPVLKDLVTWAGPKLVEGFKSFSGWFKTVMVDIEQFAGKVGKAKDIIGGIAEDVKAGKKIDWQDLMNLSGLFTNQLDIQRKFAEIVTDISEGIYRIKDAFRMGGLEIAVTEISQMIGEGFAKINWEKIKTDLTSYWTNTLQPALQTAWTEFSTWIAIDEALTTQLGTALGTAFSGALKKMSEQGPAAWGSELGASLGSALGGSVDAASFWDSFGSAIKRGVVGSTTLETAIKSVLDGMLAAILKDNPTLANYIGTLRDIVTGLKQAETGFGTFKEALAAGFTNPFQGMADVIDAVAEAITNAINAWWAWVDATGGGGGAFSGGTSHGSMWPGGYGGAPSAPYNPLGGGSSNPGRGATPATMPTASAGDTWNFTLNFYGNPDPKEVEQSVYNTARKLGYR